jgi:hypothetical protein
MLMEMFVKNVEKTTLEVTFKESIKVENNILGMKGNPGPESSKDKPNIKFKSTLTKNSYDNKDIDSMLMQEHRQ